MTVASSMGTALTIASSAWVALMSPGDRLSETSRALGPSCGRKRVVAIRDEYLGTMASPAKRLEYLGMQKA